MVNTLEKVLFFKTEHNISFTTDELCLLLNVVEDMLDTMEENEIKEYEHGGDTFPFEMFNTVGRKLFYTLKPICMASPYADEIKPN